ncbi:MAG: Tim44/TimA family putative adaptor protein [Alphaproteobacteria bacterium]|nr:Tim44/TimA family putative adaptor protein [Alphaproteobacteria bacterium]
MLDILIYAAIAAFLAVRLWSVLGQRDEEGEDKPSRQSPFTPREKTPPSSERPNHQDAPEATLTLADSTRPPLVSALTSAGHAPASLAGALDQIKMVDPHFHEKDFLAGARVAFTAIVSAFASGDLSAVTRFLGPKVRQSFEDAIAARAEENLSLENRIERIVAADIVEAQHKGAHVALTVEFISHQVNVLRDAQSRILEGTAARAEEVRDFWVFERDLTSGDPNWLLTETQS